MDTLRTLSARYHDLMADRDRLLNEADMLREASPSAARLSDMPAGGGDPSNPTYVTVARILDLEAQAEKKIADVDAVAMTMSHTISVSTPIAYHNILRSHYFHGTSYDALAAIYGYTPDHIARLCRKYGSVPAVEVRTCPPNIPLMSP